MSKRSSILVGVLMALSLVLAMVWPANAQATRIAVDMFEYDCGNGWEKDWMEGQVWHIRNYAHTNRIVSDSPELNGVNTTVADAEIMLKSGYVVIRGTSIIEPDTIDGTWKGTWTFIANAGVIHGYSVYQGTGELSGKSLFLNLFDPPNIYTPEEGAAACAGLGDYEANTAAEGYILETPAP